MSDLDRMIFRVVRRHLETHLRSARTEASEARRRILAALSTAQAATLADQGGPAEYDASDSTPNLAFQLEGEVKALVQMLAERDAAIRAARQCVVNSDIDGAEVELAAVASSYEIPEALP